MRLILGVLLCFALAAQAQSWPERPIRIVVPFPPGPSVDLVARLVAPKMSEALGQPVVVENRLGANGLVASAHVAAAAPDGYTILATTPSTHVTSIFLSKNLGFDPVRDFTPIVAAVEPVTALAVHIGVPARTTRELIDYAKRNPGRISYGTSGVGSVFHMTGELLKQTAGIDMVHVPYKGVAPAMADLASGQIQVGFTPVATALAYEKQGKIRMLAVLEDERYARMPNVPALREAVPGFRKPASWFGFFGPAGLPAPVVARLNREINAALRAADVRGKLEDVGFALIGGTPGEFAAMHKAGIEQYGAIIRAAGIQPE